MAINDLTDSIMDHLSDLLENNRTNIQDALAAKGYDTEIKKIWKDDQHIIDAYPCIVLVASRKTVQWAATRYRDERYDFFIDCLSKVAKKEEAARFIRCFGSAIQNVLNDFNNLRFIVKGTKIMAFDSFAPDLEYGYKQNGAIRAARISWYVKTANPVST